MTDRSQGKKATRKGAKKTTSRKRSTAKRSRRRSKQAPPRIDPGNLPEDAVVLLAARGMVLFPHVVLPIVVGRDRSVRAVRAAVDASTPLGILLQRDETLDAPEPQDLYEVGTVATIIRHVTAPDGSHHVIAQGERRFRVVEFLQTEPYFIVRTQTIEEPSLDGREKEVEAHLLNLKARAHEALSLMPQKPEDLDQAIENAADASAATDLIATFLDVGVAEKQEVLEEADVLARMELVERRLAERIEILSLSAELRQRAQGTIEKAQREYLLREQLRQIQAELGEGGSVERDELSRAIERSKMPAAVKKEARRELARLGRMHESSSEASVLHSYLDCLLELPWGKRTRDRLDLARARAVLDEDHFGLDKVKRRILEFLAVRKLKPDGRGPILCLVGPPGVGKTSLGRSVARVLGRKFVRFSLGGVHDESEIRGHRRTYVGAMPGSILQQIRKAGTMNPVFLLDELDKLERSLQGDPAAALLEVLDPEQNHAFVDRYLNVPFDLSRVFFLATANVAGRIPGPLRDRCEVIEIPGYTHEEKREIARRYLLDRQRENCGLPNSALTVDDEALDSLIRSYTREAGCRALEREIGAIARWAATRIAEGKSKTVHVGASDLAEILGPERFENELALRTSSPGVAMGLAWTPTGGELLFLEATRMGGKGKLILTGQLGDVMKESARTALSLLRTRAESLGLADEDFERTDVHLHVPAGAIPKDGPSAGVAMFLALVSLWTGRRARSRTAVTGEISLRGLVLPVGGIKNKVLAAHEAGVETVLLPERNRKDFEEIPERVREGLRFLWIDTVDAALDAALEPAESEGAPGRRGRGQRLSARPEDA